MEQVRKIADLCRRFFVKSRNGVSLMLRDSRALRGDTKESRAFLVREFRRILRTPPFRAGRIHPFDYDESHGVHRMNAAARTASRWSVYDVAGRQFYILDVVCRMVWRRTSGPASYPVAHPNPSRMSGVTNEATVSVSHGSKVLASENSLPLRRRMPWRSNATAV